MLVPAEVQLGVGGHVIEPGTDDAERHRPDRDVADQPGPAATRGVSPLTDPDRDLLR